MRIIWELSSENYQWKLLSENYDRNYDLVYNYAEKLRFIGILAYPKIADITVINLCILIKNLFFFFNLPKINYGILTLNKYSM